MTFHVTMGQYQFIILNVWIRIVGDYIIFIVDGNSNADNYLAMLQNNVIPTLMPLDPDQENSLSLANMT